MADISKFMSKDVGDLGKLLRVDKSNLSKFMGANMPSGYPPVAPWTETFTGDNGSDPNSTYWNSNQYLKIQSNQLHGAVNNTSGILRSKFFFVGNFDIFVSFDDLITGTEWNNRIELVAGTASAEDVVLIGARWRDASVFYGFMGNAGGYYGHTQAARSNNYGGLRITRSGTTVTLQYKDGGGNWTTLTSNTIATPNFRAGLSIYSLSIGNVSSDFDDFTIQSGTVI